MGEIGVQAYHANRVGATVAEASKRLAALKFASNITGVAGGIINAYSMWVKAGDVEKDGDLAASDLYMASAFMFAGTAFTSTALAIGGLAETAVARGGIAATSVVRTLAVRAGSTAASAALVTVGGTALTVAGIGLVLLGVGIVVQIGAVALTPSDVQRWVGRSYFGVDREILEL